MALRMRHVQTLTFEEVGNRLGGVTRERARQIVHIAEMKFRYLKNRGYETELSEVVSEIL